MFRPLKTDPGLTKINGELFNLRRILWLLDSARHHVRYRSEKALIGLVSRLVRVQQQRIRELMARVEFLQKDALQAERDHQNRRQELATLQGHHDDMTRRLDSIMQRTR